MEIDYHLIGARIKEQRRKQGLTQEFLSEKLNVSVGYVSQVERGITKISLDLLAKIATILNCDIAIFVSGTSVGGKDYMAEELFTLFSQLTSNNKQFLLDILSLLINREMDKK